jgi:Tfp pilus assembly protein PilN
MVDLNKEIKLSDLFRRRERDSAQEKGGAPAEDERKKERRSLFSRTPREKAPAATKAKRPGKRAVVEPTAAPELPQIPLMRAFNLMPKEEPRKKGRRVGIAPIAVGLLGIVVVAGLGGGYLFASAGATSKQSEVDDLRAQLAALQLQSETPVQADTALTSVADARRTALSSALASRIAWDRILRKFSLVIPEDVWLTQITASTPNASSGTATAPTPSVETGTTSPNSFSITGSAPEQETVALLLSRLANIPEFTSVQLESSARNQGGAGFEFTILVGVDPLGGSAP